MVIWHQTYGKGHMIAREEPHCCHYMSDSFQLAARVILFTSFHRQDNAYHGLCYTNRGALAGIRNILMDPLWRLNLMTHCTMSECSYHGATTPIGNGDGFHTKGERSFMVDPLSYFLFQPVLFWYVLSCLWDGAYKITLAVNRKD